ncbi:uncharacterized protein LOC119441021 [Dermacentor silvarum]|uniref:uncharacterized protein LOC119441021 n=1 Tax=Dermacentor silvarum TaxID=543639 RepID=UPI002100F720|nr:uncharacterized protein LOC119441021 [Dermacentor silvarum]
MDVYLGRVSGVPMETAKHFHCVRSSYQGYEPQNQTVYRSVKFEYNNDSETWNRSVNISLQVKNQPMSLLEVTLLANLGRFPYEVEVLRYDVPVHYGDGKCLILGHPYIPDAGPQNRHLSCSMWLTERYANRPPLCCQMLYIMMCGKSWVEMYEEQLCNKTGGNKI